MTHAKAYSYFIRNTAFWYTDSPLWTPKTDNQKRFIERQVMLAVNTYPLWYDGAGMHELLGIAKASLDGSFATKTDRQALAEYFLNKLDYASNPGKSGAGAMYGGSYSYSRTDTNQPIEAIHRACKAEIESKWQRPQMSDEQVAEMLLADNLEPEYMDLLTHDVHKTFGIRL